ncbi:MAG TPA: MBL fold metallo-hydrolase [Spirochaetota bacterium]|nr:MBL fold metallo-hydrolase [Spirochaetota bacterium]
MFKTFFIFVFILVSVLFIFSKSDLSSDIIKTDKSDLSITFIGHGSLLFNYDNKNIYIDPYSKLYDYSQLPKADLILITHEHGDHLDQNAINILKTDKTQVIINESGYNILKYGQVMKNGDKKNIFRINIEAVPSYNIVNKRPNGVPFHPEGMGNGYIIAFSNKKVYIAGDTENIPYMNSLKDIDIAFLPVNLPYTMTIEMAYLAVTTIKPNIFYPYHFGETDIQLLVKMIKDKNIEVRIRNMK